MVIKMTMKKVLGCIRKADEEFDLIQDGDKICVGVSGGKDSTLLLYCLSLYKKFARVKFDVVGVHIEMGFPNMDFSEVDTFCKKNNIELYHEPSDVYEILKLNKTDDGRLQAIVSCDNGIRFYVDYESGNLYQEYLEEKGQDQKYHIASDDLIYENSNFNK